VPHVSKYCTIFAPNFYDVLIPWSMISFWITFELFSTSQETHCISITRINRLMLLKAIPAGYPSWKFSWFTSSTTGKCQIDNSD
jgi:hypothetical protein